MEQTVSVNFIFQISSMNLKKQCYTICALWFQQQTTQPIKCTSASIIVYHIIGFPSFQTALYPFRFFSAIQSYSLLYCSKLTAIRGQGQKKLDGQLEGPQLLLVLLGLQLQSVSASQTIAEHGVVQANSIQNCMGQEKSLSASVTESPQNPSIFFWAIQSYSS